MKYHMHQIYALSFMKFKGPSDLIPNFGLGLRSGFDLGWGKGQRQGLLSVMAGVKVRAMGKIVLTFSKNLNNSCKSMVYDIF